MPFTAAQRCRRVEAFIVSFAVGIGASCCAALPQVEAFIVSFAVGIGASCSAALLAN